jgi:DNA-binding NtrC family response regulator
LTRILVADDDKLIRWSLKEILSQEGYQVDTVASSLEAVQQAESCSYSLFFADCEIDEEDGIELIRKLKSIQPETKVIVISALSRQKIESQMEGLDVFTIVEKPFQSEEILSITRRALE